MKTFLQFTFFFISFSVSAQDFEFGKVSIDEVKNNVYLKDTSANALILHKFRNSYFNHEHPEGWVIITEIHERIKILNKDGLDYGTKKIRVYNSGKDKEKIISIKAYTYNEEGGKLKSEKLNKNGIFDTEVSDNWDETSFTMPNVKVGSVVEWVYKIKSPFWKIDDLIIQANIPTAHYFAKIETLSYFNFTRIAKGRFNVTPKDYNEQRTLNILYEQSSSSALTQATRSTTIQTTQHVAEFELNDISALKEEPYVDNINNYRFLITYELRSTEFPNNGLKEYSTTWEEVVKTINKSEDFGEELKNTKFLKEEVERLKLMGTGSNLIMNNVFEFVKNKMNWNGNYGKYTDLGIHKAYKEGTGNVSEINLLLVALLRECGLKANPVLVSTRKNGIPIFPTLEGFNYVIACAELNGQDILMDATEKLITPGMLPERVLNWEGTLVLEDGQSRKIDLYPKTLSQVNTQLNITIDEEGNLEGKQRSSFTDLDALKYRENFKKLTKEEYIEDLINNYAFDELNDFEADNIDDLNKHIIETFNFGLEEGVDIIGNEIYISPLFFLKTNSSPFNLEERNYPVNFVYPQSRRKIINIKIPLGYKVTSLPKPMNVSLPNELGSFLFIISEVEGGLNVMSTFKINSSVIPSHLYFELKEFYKMRIIKEAEKVVLSKI